MPNWSSLSNGATAQAGALYAGWNSAETEDTYSVSWGDYDNDGDLDMAVGNSGPSRIYRNNGNNTFTSI